MSMGYHTFECEVLEDQHSFIVNSLFIVCRNFLKTLSPDEICEALLYVSSVYATKKEGENEL